MDEGYEIVRSTEDETEVGVSQGEDVADEVSDVGSEKKEPDLDDLDEDQIEGKDFTQVISFKKSE